MNRIICWEIWFGIIPLRTKSGWVGRGGTQSLTGKMKKKKWKLLIAAWFTVFEGKSCNSYLAHLYTSLTPKVISKMQTYMKDLNQTRTLSHQLKYLLSVVEHWLFLIYLMLFHLCPTCNIDYVYICKILRKLLLHGRWTFNNTDCQLSFRSRQNFPQHLALCQFRIKGNSDQLDNNTTQLSYYGVYVQFIPL